MVLGVRAKEMGRSCFGEEMELMLMKGLIWARQKLGFGLERNIFKQMGLCGFEIYGLIRRVELFFLKCF